MPVISSIDTVNNRIHLSASTVGVDLHPIDIYKEYRALRRTDETLRKFYPMMKADGNVQKTATTFTERYVTLLNGARVVPYDASHSLRVIGTIITDDGNSGIDCFDRLPLSTSVEVDIDYQPPQVEIIKVNTSQASLSPSDIAAVVSAMFSFNVEGSETFVEQMRLIRAEAAGKLSAVGNTVTIRDAADTKDRITATVDDNGQRTAVTTDVS